MAKTSSIATTNWQGSLMEGKGTTELTTSGVATFDVAWNKRAESGQGTTNPEELLASAYATCYTMALSNKLSGEGNTPNSIKTVVTVTFNVGVGIDQIDIEVEGDVPGLEADAFAKEAEWAKDNCPVGAALAAVENKTLTVK